MGDDREPPATPGPVVAAPQDVHTAEQLTQALDLLRRRAAHGSRRRKASLDDIAARTGVPRSTLHTYLQGARLPPSDVLDAIVQALGVRGAEQREWAHALERVEQTGPPPAPATSTARSAWPPRARLLPMAPQGFSGREPELATLHRLVSPAWATPPAPAVLVGLCGTGGVGKTALALHFAHCVAENFPDGQLWLDLGGFGPRPFVDTSAALSRLLEVLGVDTTHLSDDVEVRAAVYRDALDGRRMMVVLDNVRDAAQIRHLLPGSPGCATVVTSRSSLRTLVVSEGAHRVDVGRLSPHDASLLVDTVVPAGAQESWRTLLDACDGLPLALRILRERLSRGQADQIDHLAAQVADRRARLREFELDEDDGLGVAAVVRSSYDVLPPELARLLRRLTVIGSATVDLAVAAAADGAGLEQTARAMDRLVAASLLDRAGPRSFRLHDLIAVFAAERSEEQDDAADVTRALNDVAAYFADRLASIRGTAEPPAVAAASPVATRIGPLRDPAVTPPDWLTDAMPVIAGLAANNWRSTDPQSVWALLELAQETAHDHVDTELIYHALGTCAADAGRRGDEWNECRLLQRFAIGAASHGDPVRAREAFERAVELSERIGQLREQAKALGNLAQLESRLGRPAVALRLRERSLELLNAAGSGPNQPTLGGLAAAYLQVGNLTRAMAVQQQALSLAQRDGDPKTQARMLYQIGGIALSEPDLPQARRVSHECMQSAAESGVHSLVMSAHVLDAAVRLASGDETGAASSVEQARAVPVAGSVVESVDLHIVAGRVLAAAGDVDAALAEHRAALDVARHLSVRFPETIALLNVARSLRRLGRTDEARLQAGAALRLATECGFARLADHAEQELAHLDRTGS